VDRAAAAEEIRKAALRGDVPARQRRLALVFFLDTIYCYSGIG
jgi:hypothetical protein